MSTQESVSPRIVVGVDGSPSSEAALRWALSQAELAGSVVDAVIAWQYPVSYGWPVMVTEADLAGWAGKTLSESIARVLDPDGSVDVRRLVLSGDASQVLLDTARGAQLLVVGNRGHGGFTQALLGSVSQHCVHHAECPVVIVRDAQPAS
ncbi:universal stress protein [Streptomyces odonnellii]|uniref:universal stress protein n=1 Tax=Streptomyces odonnellii TaxID=1417980 RepID=UPI000626E58A|nr:universal stress protein [Streptomyces odonnellii]